jgi:hypothetical protein
MTRTSAFLRPRLASLAAAAALAATSLAGCSGGGSDASSTSSDEQAALSTIPKADQPSVIAALEWFEYFEDTYPELYVASTPDQADARPWLDGFDPATDDVFSHNELDFPGVTPQALLALMVEGQSNRYYPNSSAATDCSTGDQVTLTLGESYCWTTFGSVQHMTIEELVDDPSESVIAWEGGTTGVTSYHRWIFRQTASGTHAITEECERGLLPDLGFYSDRMNPSLHVGHQLWLEGMQSFL